MLALVLAFLLAILSGCQKTAPATAKTAVLAIEPIKPVVQYTSSAFSVIDLGEQGTRDAVLVHLSSNDNFASLPEEKIRSLHALLQKKEWESLKTAVDVGSVRFLSSDNYVYAAARLGMVKEIYWVLPWKLLQYSDAERRVQFLLSSSRYGFPRNQVSGMQYRDGCVSGNLMDVPVHVCSVETFPKLSGPVVLDIDTGFFPAYALERKINVMGGVRMFFEYAASLKIAVSRAFIRRDLHDGALSPLYLHLSDNIQALLENPLLTKMAPPEPWKLADESAAILTEGDFGDAARYLKEARKKYPQDRYLLRLGLVADELARGGTRDPGSLTGLCEKDREDCALLVFVGRKLRQTGKDQAAERYFSSALRVRPGLLSALGELADIHVGRKNYEEALKLYRQMLLSEDSFATRLRVGDCLALLDQPEGARIEYTQALEMIHNTSQIDVSDDELPSLRRARELFLKTGDGAAAAMISQLLLTR